jgi:hypothetical protein
VADLDPIPFDGRHTDDDIELFGEYRWLYPIVIEGDRFLVPEDNFVLRAIQYVEITHRAVRMPWADYCWNNTTGCCEMRYRDSAEGPEKIGRACCIAVHPGMEILALPKGGRKCRR